MNDCALGGQPEEVPVAQFIVNFPFLIEIEESLARSRWDAEEEIWDCGFWERVKKELDNVVLDILNDPKIGIEKLGDLSGVLVHKFKINIQLTLLSYTYTDSEINLLTFGGHEN